jgi:hypothetical protein
MLAMDGAAGRPSGGGGGAAGGEARRPIWFGFCK